MSLRRSPYQQHNMTNACWVLRVAAFILYFGAIDPIGNAPIFVADLSVQYLSHRLTAIGIFSL